ncbi:glycosyltransferase family 2 protein [Candidatus Finniella inopinata]|uniref:Glycosyltransferase n=1 Tax=Candidatus Finniella inopinata TaxID=1696036 RepID=A0A4Q7DJH9_9PROT|nr:glycosyltransferase family 2 protein [Candidatus Finniella inopinata]RZI47151.1 glycosyltransferase [Candidatus Finniella inopinata]
MDKAKYSFVIPIFNEEKVLHKLFERLEDTLGKLDGSAEIISVDDGSSDNSYELLQQQFQKDSRFKVLKFSRNFGHQNAVTAGLDQADGEAVIIMDADLQDPPEVVFDLIKQWQAGFDVVHAVRQSRQGETWFKLATANLFYRFLEKITETKIVRNAGDFRLMDRKVVEAFRQLREQHRFLRGLSCWVGFKQGCVLYERHARFAGETKYPLRKMLKLAVNAITSFSDWPLRLSFLVGSVISVLSMLAIMGIITAKLFTDFFIPGWTSVVVILTFFNGIIMMMLGLMGVYIGKIFQEIKGRPLYIVETKHGL